MSAIRRLSGWLWDSEYQMSSVLVWAIASLAYPIGELIGVTSVALVFGGGVLVELVAMTVWARLDRRGLTPAWAQQPARRQRRATSND